MKRVFLIVLDSLGVGALPDAHLYGDEGSNTLASCTTSPYFKADTMRSMGLFNIDGINCGKPFEKPIGCFGRMIEASAGKDTTTGHWEIAGLVSEKPFDYFPEGFPESFIAEFERLTGRRTVCNRPYSGTEVIKDFGLHHQRTGDLIVYTSADSVFQIAAHKQVVSVDKLYEYCEIARELLNKNFHVGRVIARPFIGQYSSYIRTSNRHDYSVEPPDKTALDYIKENGLEVIGIGKINDIYAGKGITSTYKTISNSDGMRTLTGVSKRAFNGLCFVNLVDFDSSFGHRNDIDGYAKAIAEFDAFLGKFIEQLEEDDLLIITADHGCDPATPSTDHSREYVPLLVYGKKIKSGLDLGTRSMFTDVGLSVCSALGIACPIEGEDFFKEIIENGN